ALDNAGVERLGADQYRIASPPREWLIAATAVHLHREIAAQFYRAIPPRPVPRLKRWLWRVVLALAASRAGLAALRALRRWGSHPDDLRFRDRQPAYADQGRVRGKLAVERTLPGELPEHARTGGGADGGE